MGNCPKCYYKRWIKTDRCNQDEIPYWKCGRCGKVMLGDYPFERQEPKILYIDIENSLTDLYGNFGLTVRGERLSHKMIRHPYYVICWSAMWAHSERIYSGCVTQEDALARNDGNILPRLWDLMSRADIVAGHNVINYDIKAINTRFIANGMRQPLQYKTLDTLRMARKKYRMESNTLDYICGFFGINGKDKMERQDWVDIQETGDPKKLKKMLKYNRGDVRNGMQVLRILKEWDALPANVGMQTFPREPVDKRAEAVTPLREIQDALDDIQEMLK